MAKKRAKRSTTRSRSGRPAATARKKKASPKKKTAKKASSKKTVARKKTTARSSSKSTAGKRGRAGGGASSVAPESPLNRLLDRVRPLLKKPLDPRFKHLIGLFGEAAVMKMSEAYRRRMADGAAAEGDQRPPLKHGDFAWHELTTRDAGRARSFYAQMFGWQGREVEMMPGFMYTIMKHGGQDVAGIYTAPPEQGMMTPQWTLYVAVNDVDASAAQAERLGGEIIVPPHDIPVGRWAMLKDPTGAMFAIYKSSSR